MADQAPVRNNGDVSGEGVVGSITGFTNDVFSLVELQAKLAAVDLKESSLRALYPSVIVGVALTVILAGMAVGLLGIAKLLGRVFTISEDWALILTAGTAIGLATGVILVSLRQITHSMQPIRRSQDELIRNLSWLKTVLVHSGRPAPGRRDSNG